MNDSIDDEDLEWDGDVRMLNGQPYSGASYSKYSDGQLAGEYQYKDGFNDGLRREWFPNGQLKQEWIARRGQAYGEIKEWHKNGQIKSIGIAEFGVMLRYKEWDHIGNLRVIGDIDENTELMEYVRILRARRVKQTLHEWQVDEAEAIAIQNKLAPLVIRDDTLTRVSRVAGVDVAYDETGRKVYAAVVVLDSNALDVIEVKTAIGETTFPYIPGLFAFRELPHILAAMEKLSTQPDLIICDGQGIAHPRRFGLASHLGVLTELPTIGCGKTRHIGEYGFLDSARGSTADLCENGETIGQALRTQDTVSPLFVSIGHRVSLDRAVQWILRLSNKFRQPEPIRHANEIVRTMRAVSKS